MFYSHGKVSKAIMLVFSSLKKGILRPFLFSVSSKLCVVHSLTSGYKISCISTLSFSVFLHEC